MRHLQTFRLIEAVMRAGSIRKAAEDINITASALNRRIRRFEDEFGYEIFERLPRGVRLNPAGELLIQHIRSQTSDLARVQSQVADLAGVRRGHVTIACSQALLPYFLPAQIASYRHDHPGVTFEVKVRDRAEAERDLSTFSSDIALVFEPMVLVDFEVLSSIPQQIQVVMSAEHPLASKKEIRLRECLDWPQVLPSPNSECGIFWSRPPGEGLAGWNQFWKPNPLISCVITCSTRARWLFRSPSVWMPHQTGVWSFRPLSERDVPVGHLLLGQVRGRTLPIASALFARQLGQSLEQEFGSSFTALL